LLVQYCYLLLTIEALWMYDGKERGRLVTNNLMVLMLNILRPLAHFLVRQPSPLDKSHSACAPFNFYQFDATEGSPKKKLVALVKAAVSKYPALQPVLSHAEGLIDIWDL
jgi:hypothetical protein